MASRPVRLAAPVFALALALGLAAPPASSLSVEVGLDFTGAFGSDSGWFPPDTMGAVGPDHIVQLLNGLYRVFDKETGALLESSSSAQFWTDTGIVPSDNFDPRVTYDPFAERWYALETDARRSPDNRYLFAVSESADPTGGWTSFAIDSDAGDTRWADYPMLGFNADAVYLSANMFSNVGDAVLGLHTSLVVLPKDDLLAPTPTIANSTEFQNLPTTTLNVSPQQTVDLDGLGGPAYMVSESGIPGIIQLSRVQDPGGTPVLDAGLAGLVFVDAVGGGTPTAAEQPGGAQALDVISERFVSNLVLQNGSLWGVRMVNDLTGRTTAQWFEFDPDTRIVLQSGVISDPERNLIYPSIAVNELDQIVIGFTGVSEDEFASAYAIFGETLDGTTRFGEPFLIRAGESPYEGVFNGRNRWGDYSATVVDPENPNVFWTFQEWAAGPHRWATQITQLLVVPEPGTLLLVGGGVVLLAGRRRAPSRAASVQDAHAGVAVAVLGGGRGRDDAEPQRRREGGTSSGRPQRSSCEPGGGGRKQHAVHAYASASPTTSRVPALVRHQCAGS